MIYIEKTTLFNLNTINYTKIEDEIKSSGSTFVIDLAKLKRVVDEIQSESMIVNKTDAPVTFTFEVVSDVSHFELRLEQSFNLLPHISNGSTTFKFYMYFSVFSKLDHIDIMDKIFLRYGGTGVVKPESSSMDTIMIVNALKKIDRLLLLDNVLVDVIYKEKIYSQISHLELRNSQSSSYVDFKVIVSKNHLTFTSKCLYRNRKNDKTPVLSISMYREYATQLEEDVDLDIDVEIQIYGQLIKLSYRYFMAADIDDLSAIIVSLFKMSQYDVKSIECLKNDLLVRHMETI